ncbi:MAG: flavin reductase [Flavobacteriaceae bacterium]|nr:flavin reductase [Flavobacteriaceae bacterium]
MYYSRKQIDEFDKIYKINLINSCSGYKSANLIVSKSKTGLHNVAVFSSVTHLGSNPPLLGFILRPTTVPRHTYSYIKEQGYYTINHIHEDILKDAHHTSAKYSKETSEFSMTNLQEEYLNDFKVPYVMGSPVKIGMKYIEEYHIKSNNVLMIVGEIIALHIGDELIEKNGFINLSKGNVATINGLDGYAIPRLKTRFGYQRPLKQKRS